MREPPEASVAKQAIGWMAVERRGPSMSAMNHGQAGQAQTEYGLILMLVAITVIGALTILGQQVHEMWHTIAAAMPR